MDYKKEIIKMLKKATYSQLRTIYIVLRSMLEG